MSLRAKLGALSSETEPIKTVLRSAFTLEEPSTLTFDNSDQFYAAIEAQTDCWAQVPADNVARIGLDGKIEGSDLKLSRAAFADMCAFTGVPLKFINSLSAIDSEQALDVLETMISAYLHSGSGKKLMVDTRYDRVEGIVGADTYSEFSNKAAVDYLLSAVPGLELSTGWLCGPSMRASAISKQKTTEVMKGDILRVGVSVENAVHGDRSLKVREYSERLVCTNGMTAVQDGSFAQIIHRGDIHFAAAQAIVQAATKAENMIMAAGIAAKRFMFANDVRQVRDFVRTKSTQSMEVAVVKGAQEEAEKEGRQPEETTLWNWVNAITEQAHGMPTIQRRVAVEGLGHTVMFRFLN